MVEAVGSGLAVIKMRRRDPFAGAVFAFSSGPALFGERVMAPAAEA